MKTLILSLATAASVFAFGGALLMLGSDAEPHASVAAERSDTGADEARTPVTQRRHAGLGSGAIAAREVTPAAPGGLARGPLADAQTLDRWAQRERERQETIMPTVLETPPHRLLERLVERRDAVGLELETLDRDFDRLSDSIDDEPTPEEEDSLEAVEEEIDALESERAELLAIATEVEQGDLHRAHQWLGDELRAG